MTSSTAALVPGLTALDERVLRALEDVAPAPAERVVRQLYPVTRRSAGASPAMAREAVEVLHGLERVGRAHERDGRWHVGARP